jgi:RNA-directed DNA polymerase
MENRKGRQVSKPETSNQQLRVKPKRVDGIADFSIPTQSPESPMFNLKLMEEILERENLQLALKRVKSNKGSAGADGLTVEKLPDFLKENWLSIKDLLLRGEYTPRVVKRVEIPKACSDDKRKLGIASVLDRFIQQAVGQVLQTKWDVCFSEYSYGFRLGKSAHHAIAKAQCYIRAGYEMVVDLDLEKFFDKVCHDRLMSKLGAEIEDKRVLKLIRSYLTAGVLENGLISTPTKGVMQGGPLSPLLSNIVLDELDKELEKRGHKFVRYADDINIYVKSQRAGERVMQSVTRFISLRLKLKVNEGKSAVDHPQKRKFLGYTFTSVKASSRMRISPESLKKFRARVRQITRRNRGQSLKNIVEQLSVFLRGWKGYYGKCETPTVLRNLDSWIRHRLRCMQWKQWKVYAKRKKELIHRGVPADLSHLTAWSAKGPWRISQSKGVQMALNTKYFDSIGLVRLV